MTQEFIKTRKRVPYFGTGLGISAILILLVAIGISLSDTTVDSAPGSAQAIAPGTQMPIVNVIPGPDATRTVEPQSQSQAATGVRAGEMLSAYQSGKSLRGFILDALKSPENGAAFYARKILSECQEVDRFTDMNALVQPESKIEEESRQAVLRISAFDYLKRRCEGLTAEERMQSAELLSSAAIYSKDLLSMIDRDYRASTKITDTALRRDALSKVVAVKDPLLLDALGLRIGLYRVEAGGGSAFEYRGKSYDLTSNAEVIAAVQLLPCGLGLRCDEKEGLVGLHCADGGICYSGRFDEIRNGIFKDQPEKYAKTIDIYNQMLGSINSRAVDDFIRR